MHDFHFACHGTLRLQTLVFCGSVECAWEVDLALDPVWKVVTRSITVVVKSVAKACYTTEHIRCEQAC